MKKQVAIAMGLAVLSTGALASKARLEALGQDSFGSMFLDDARNVLLNPAHLNYHKDFITFEWGNTDAGTTNAGGNDDDQDAANSPKAEGGMFKASGNMVYGLYLGAESNVANELRAAAMGANVVNESNNLDVFFAGDAGVQWGARITRHSFADKQNNADISSEALRAAVGVISGDLEGFLNLGLTNKAEKATAEFNGKSSFAIGLTYGMGDVDYMAQIESIQAEDANSDEFKAQNIDLGVAKKYKLNDKATAWASAWYKMDTKENSFTASGKPGEEKLTHLPVSFALEVAAKEWLTLRGSVSQNIIGETENDAGDKKTVDNTTVVTAGAALTWGDLTIDGMIGNNSSTGVAGTDTSAAAGSAGTLRTDTLMSRVSMTYKF